jgi:hypothetical protein
LTIMCTCVDFPNENEEPRFKQLQKNSSQCSSNAYAPILIGKG